MGSGAKTVSELFAEYPNLVTYVPGHTHENRVIAYPKKTSDIFWEINTSAVIDHPQQSRLIEVFDNRDGTLSIFGTILDHASPATPPAGGTAASGFDGPRLASVGRSFAFNDPQSGQAATESGDTPPPTGLPRDQNVELLLGDPRLKHKRCKGLGARLSEDQKAKRHAATILGTTGNDRIKGTKRRDVIVTGPGRDRVRGRGGRDIICAGKGADRLKGGGGRDIARGNRGSDRVSVQRGNDRPVGGRGGDRVKGGRGRDRVSGGKGNDRLAGGKGVDGIAGGAGKKDRCRAEQRRDRFTFDGCERVTGRGRG